jgi:class 3 adenylate cyclase
MNRIFRKLLDNAAGITEHIVAVVLDIREFTPFCKDTESPDVAVFLKNVYTRIIDAYFPNASFYKPTGDGLLVIVPYSAKSLQATVSQVVGTCLRLVEDFRKFCKDEPMINFPVPDKIGIGICRGIACRISSDGTILDYSGRVINLSSRLMDIARPSGVVIDSGLGLHLLPDEMQKRFLCDSVYIKGIAENKPTAIYYTRDYTLISPSYKTPIKEPRWETVRITHYLEKIKKAHSRGAERTVLVLLSRPLDEKRVLVDLYVPREEGQVWHVGLDTTSTGLQYEERGKKYFLYINNAKLLSELSRVSITNNAKLIFEITYPVSPK